MGDVRTQAKRIPRPEMSGDLAHGEPHFTLHDQRLGIKGVRVHALNGVRPSLSLERFSEASRQRLCLEDLKSEVCQVGAFRFRELGASAASSTRARPELLAIR